MVRFSTTVLKFGEQGEKTGWTYIVINASQAQKLKPGNRKSFRVKGLLDKFVIRNVAVMPMGDGSFVMPINAAMRKGTGKRKNDEILVQLEADTSELKLPPELEAGLKDEPEAKKIFYSYAKSHQRYFINWIDSGKTDSTRVKRAALAINALLHKMNFAEMLRAIKARKDEFLS